MNPFQALSRVAVVAAAASALLVFLLDMQVPRGVAIGALYVIPILLTLLADRRAVTLWAAAGCSLLTIAGYLLSPSIGIQQWVPLTDRTIVIALQWVTAILGIEMTSAKRQLRELGKWIVMCAWTKQVRVQDRWIPIEEYLSEYLGFKLTHGMTEEGRKQLMREMGVDIR